MGWRLNKQHVCAQARAAYMQRPDTCSEGQVQGTIQSSTYVRTCCGATPPPCSSASRQLRAEVRRAAAVRPARHTRLGSSTSPRNFSDSSRKRLRQRRFWAGFKLIKQTRIFSSISTPDTKANSRPHPRESSVLPPSSSNLASMVNTFILISWSRSGWRQVCSRGISCLTNSPITAPATRHAAVFGGNSLCLVGPRAALT